MKKTLVAIAAFAAASAFAQSSVTLSGGLGFGYQSNPAKARGLTMTDYAINLGVSEDLGGGMSAFANMSLTDAVAGSSAGYRQGIARDSLSMGLRGGFGALTLANTRSSELAINAFVAPSSLPDGFYDGGVFTRAPVDAISYTTPNFSGFTGVVGYSESGTDGNTTPTNKTFSLGANYSNGPLAAGLVFRSSNPTLPLVLARKSNIEGFATYDLGVAKLGFGFDTKRTTVAADKLGFALGVAVPVGPVTVGLNYAKRDTLKITEVAANYALSKRTSINFSAGKQTNDANSQYRLKMQHNF